MYWLIIVCSRWWLEQNHQRNEEHYFVKLLQKRAMGRAGFIALLGIVARFNTTPGLCYFPPNQWFFDRQNEFNSELITWEEFRDCIQWQHMMS
jgi:hypothetical protein